MLVGEGHIHRWANVARATPAAAKPLDLGKARWLQLTYETIGNCSDLFPRGLHPTTPVLATIQFWDVGEGDLGPFKMAQVRLTCRAGIRIRALMTNSVIDSAKAAAVLSHGWGYLPNIGDIELSWRTDQIRGTVEIGGDCVMRGGMKMPMPIGGDDLQHITSVNPAFVDSELRLLQVEPRFQNLGVQRAAPSLERFDGEFWQLSDHTPTYPVIAACADVALSLPPVRFMQDPAQLAHKGTTAVAAG